jgi:cytochrome b pre-mRNA-processing protein 3
MILAHFNRKRKNREIVDGLYRQLTAIARNPAFYADMHVPDTVMGRFEMMTLAMVLFLRRTHDRGPALTDLAQSIVDTFFEDMDHSLRELGVGDVSVPKRMKKLARMFYGRAQSYGNALSEGDLDELARSLGRNLYPQDRAGAAQPPGDLRPLADAVSKLEAQLAQLADGDLLSGRLDMTGNTNELQPR